MAAYINMLYFVLPVLICLPLYASNYSTPLLFISLLFLVPLLLLMMLISVEESGKPLHAVVFLCLFSLFLTFTVTIFIPLNT